MFDNRNEIEKALVNETQRRMKLEVQISQVLDSLEKSKGVTDSLRQ
jgi:hypothetical protein